MQTRRMKSIASILILLVVVTGCIHKVGNAPVTPWERITTNNAILAQSINTLEHGAEAAASTTLLSDAKAAKVINFSANCAKAHDKVTDILAKGQSVSVEDAAALQNFIQFVEAQATELVNSGDFGVKNPKSQQMFDLDIKNLSALAAAILSDVQIVKIIGSGSTQIQWNNAATVGGVI